MKGGEDMFRLPIQSNKKIDTSKLTVSPVKIYVTQDYGMFKKIIGNRDVKSNHVAQLTRKISRKNRLSTNPMNVNEYAGVIDGQTRLRSAEILKAPIYFTISEGDGLDEVQVLNSGTKTWSTYDYLDSYIVTGHEEYKRFKDFIERFQLAIEGGFVLIGNNNGDAMYDKFRAGDLRFTEEQWESGEVLANAFWEIKPYFKDKGHRRVYLYKSLWKIREKEYLNLLVDKLRTWNPPLHTQYALKDYLRMFEDVLNIKNKGKLIRLF